MARRVLSFRPLGVCLHLVRRRDQLRSAAGGHVRRHHVADPAAYRQQGDQKGKDQVAHGMNDKAGP